MGDIGINLEALHSGLKAVKTLRSTVLEVFKFLGDGSIAGSTDEEREKYIGDVQSFRVASCIRELETACTLLGTPPPPLQLGNSGLLSQDPAYEKTPLYAELIKSHRWFDKVNELSTHASAILGQNNIKRPHYGPLMSSKQLKNKHIGHNVPPQSVDATTAQLIRIFPDLQMQVKKPYGSSAIIMVSVSRTLKALIMLRGLLIEWVVTKGYNEDFYTEDDKLDIWSGSRYLVFQKVTEHANAAMLHFYIPNMPEVALRTFLTWLRSYNTLFTAPCRKCGNRLHNNMPPTWRDVRTLDAYHENCKP